MPTEEEINEAEELGHYDLKQILKQSPDKISAGIVVIGNAIVAAGVDVAARWVGAANIIALTLLTLFYVAPAIKAKVDTEGLKGIDWGQQMARRPLRAEE